MQKHNSTNLFIATMLVLAFEKGERYSLPIMTAKELAATLATAIEIKKRGRTYP